jgi:hypothetical protein
MHRVHLSTGVILSVADVHAAAIKDSMRVQSARLVTVMGRWPGELRSKSKSIHCRSSY